jgi:hypothetical protein
MPKAISNSLSLNVVFQFDYPPDNLASYRRFAHSKFNRGTISLQRGAVTASNVCPELEQETCTVFVRTAEIAVLAEIDMLVKDLRKNPGVLEEVVPRRRLDRAVRKRPLRRQPRYKILGFDNRAGGEA